VNNDVTRRNILRRVERAKDPLDVVKVWATAC
jgi:hypothetical protein